MPTAKQTPIADWLRSTRERQLREDGEPWSQDDFLRELEKSSGWRLHRPNYSAYETGRSTPRGVNLSRLVRFWQDRGEPGPDLTPPVPVLSFEERAVIAAERQAAAAERSADTLRLILEAVTPATPQLSAESLAKLLVMSELPEVRTLLQARASHQGTPTG